ncbi:hypothetical protein EDB84DRAFT_450851 [Lactarius hengduanensis]|nr:hypothetical protein EDB84DRAFT_450851 [Lactarius hengduanensis]
MVKKLVGWGSIGGNSHHHLSMISSLSFLVRRRGDTPSPFRRRGRAEGTLRWRSCAVEVAIVKLVLVLVKQLENDILTAVAFLPRTGTRVGHVKRGIRYCRRLGPLRRTSRAATHGTLIGLVDLRMEERCTKHSIVRATLVPILSEVEPTSLAQGGFKQHRY